MGIWLAYTPADLFIESEWMELGDIERKTWSL